MSRNDIINNVKPVKLTDDELRKYSDYSNSDARIARNEIWKCVENDQLIPNELKPVLLDLLQAEYKGMTKPPKKHNWDIIIKEISYLRKGILMDDYSEITGALTKEAAVKLVAGKYSRDADSVDREYRKPKYKNIKNSI